MSDGTIRTFKSTKSRDDFEAYIEKYIKHVDPQKIKKVKIKKLRIKKPKIKATKLKTLRIKKIKARIK